ncbi:unnamed protein product [Calypogeia fissa]
MASKRLGRFIHFANLPLRLLLPKTLDNVKEVAFKTIPNASKVSRNYRDQLAFRLVATFLLSIPNIEIKRVLESVYGLEVEKVHTLNMEGKKKLNRKSGTHYRRPDYKKAYVVLKNPVSLPKDVFPLNAFEDGSEDAAKHLKPIHNQGVKSAKRKS